MGHTAKEVIGQLILSTPTIIYQWFLVFSKKQGKGVHVIKINLQLVQAIILINTKNYTRQMLTSWGEASTSS